MYFLLLAIKPHSDSFSQQYSSSECVLDSSSGCVLVEYSDVAGLNVFPDQDVLVRGMGFVDKTKYEVTAAAVDAALKVSGVSAVTDVNTLQSRVALALKSTLGDVSQYVQAAFQQFPTMIANVVEFMSSLRTKLIQLITGQTEERSWFSVAADIVQSVKEVGVKKTATIYARSAAHSVSCTWSWAKAKLFG